MALGFGALGLALLATFLLGARRPVIRGVLLMAVSIRIAAALFHAFVSPLPDSHADAQTFERVGWEWSQQDWPAIFDSFETGSYLYSWLISALYAATARSPLMIQGINVLLGVGIVYLAYRIAFTVSSSTTVARRAAFVTALFPTLILYSAITMREAPGVFLAMLGIHFMVQWRRQLSLINIVGSLIFSVSATLFHTGFVVIPLIVTLALLKSWLDAGRRQQTTRVLASYVGLMVALGMFALVVATGAGLEKFGLLDEGIETQQQRTAVERAAYLEGIHPSNPLDYLWQAPLRTAYFLFAPFPWMATAMADVVGLVDAAIYVVLITGIVSGRSALRTNRDALVLVVIVAISILMFAIATSNYGTAIRHRAKFVPLLIVLFAICKNASRIKIMRRFGILGSHPKRTSGDTAGLVPGSVTEATTERR